MADKPDDVPSLLELGDDEELPDYWAEDTTITLSRYQKWQLDQHRDSKPWGAFLEELRRAKSDPLTLTDAEHIADVLNDNISTNMTNTSGMSYDDVKEACKAALREELPEGRR